jgi:hypothetical protein
LSQTSMSPFLTMRCTKGYRAGTLPTHKTDAQC